MKSSEKLQRIVHLLKLIEALRETTPGEATLTCCNPGEGGRFQCSHDLMKELWEADRSSGLPRMENCLIADNVQVIWMAYATGARTVQIYKISLGEAGATASKQCRVVVDTALRDGHKHIGLMGWEVVMSALMPVLELGGSLTKTTIFKDFDREHNSLVLIEQPTADDEQRSFVVTIGTPS